MRLKKYLLILSSFLVHPLYASTFNYPTEFSDFFIKQEESVLVTLLGDNVGLRLKAAVSYDEFILASSDKDIDSLKSYLSGHQISSNAIDRIIRSLIEGIPADPGCEIALEQCSPVIDESDVSYVFDYDNSRLKIFVGSQLLSKSTGEVAYYPAISRDNALINQSRIYSYTDQSDRDAGVHFSNLTTLGLPYGHLQFDTQYQTVDNIFDVYKGNYDLEVGSIRAVVGYSERNKVSFNTTDFLTDDANYTNYAIQVGSSRNLVRGGERNLQELPFFSTQAGQLEVYQGERLLLTRVVSEGRQAISYSDLPSGAYNVRLVLRAGGQIVTEEVRQVVNTRQFGLPVGEFDYVLTIGQFDDIYDETDLSWQKSIHNFEKNYGQIRASWRASDSLLFGSAVTATQDDYYVQFGGSFVWQDWLNLTYQYGTFDSNDTYQSASFAVGPLLVSARRFDNDVDNRLYRLSSQLYSERSFFNFNATYSMALYGGTGYINYSHYGADSVLNADAIFDISSLFHQKGDNVTLGWSTPLWGGQLGINAGYNKYDNYDDTTFGLYWSRNLGQSLTGQVMASGNKTGVNRAETSLTHNISKGKWSGITTASTALLRDDDTEGAFSGVVSGSTDWFNLSSYGYTNTSGQRMLSGTLTGSQFISSRGGRLTNERSNSFIHVIPEVPEIGTEAEAEAINLDDIQYHIRRGQRATYRGNLLGTDTVVPVTPYTDTEFVLDAEQRNISVDQSSRREFVYPGTVYTISPKVTPLVSQLFVLNDMYGNPIIHARCVGDGCDSVERISDDGVFRVNYKAGENIKLMSMNRLCLNSPELKSNDVVYTFCLPGLDGPNELIDLALLSNKANKGEMLYLGKFEANNISKSFQDLLTRLKDAGLVTRSVLAGNSLYLYVEYNNQLTLAQRQLLDSFDVYIVRDNVDFNELFSVR